MLVYKVSLVGLERPYEESVGVRSYTEQLQKAVVRSKNEGNYSYQFYGRRFDKEEEEEEMDNWVFAIFCMSL